jgi:hypothetical protein
MVKQYFIEATATVIEIEADAGEAVKPAAPGVYMAIAGVLAEGALTVVSILPALTGWAALTGTDAEGDVIIVIPPLPELVGETIVKLQFSLDGGALWSDLPAPSGGDANDAGARTLNLSPGKKTITVRLVGTTSSGPASSPISVTPKVSESLAEFVTGPTIEEVIDDWVVSFGEGEIVISAMPEVALPVVTFGIGQLTITG